jgi:glycosyltransferase involved in cell wall biosynthesis
MPLIATMVGGIGEIFGPQADALIPADDAGALATAIADKLDNPAAAAEFARTLRERVATHFSIDAMVDGILKSYGDGLDSLRQKGRR